MVSSPLQAEKRIWLERGLTSAAIMLTRSSSLLVVFKIDILYNFFFVEKRYPSYFKIINSLHDLYLMPNTANPPRTPSI
jgi:hypothetical protein